MDFTPRQVVLNQVEARASGLPVRFEKKDAWAQAFRLLDEIVFMDHMVEKAERVNNGGSSQGEVNYLTQKNIVLRDMSDRLIREVLEDVQPPVLDEEAFAAHMESQKA